MSYHIALNRLRSTISYPECSCHWQVQEFWYALYDRSGKLRDWIPANDAKEARFYFGKARGHELPLGYRVERRGKVERIRLVSAMDRTVPICSPVAA